MYEMKNIEKKPVLKAEFTVRYHYDIRFTENLFGSNNPLIRNYFSNRTSNGHKSKVLIMVDQGFADHHPQLSNHINSYFQTVPEVELVPEVYFFPGGETVKNHSAYQEKMLRVIDKHGIDRHSYVIGIGGGAILDAVGYAAAISHRGVRHIRIPTTVLSQNDSGIGVKNGINFFSKKNYLGSFTPPDAVWIDTGFLSTLSSRDKRSGLSEAVKVALIRDSQFFDWLESNSEDLRSFERKAMEYSIVECARLHLNHITKSGDPFERGSERPLDFGHWAAHKLEDQTNYTLRHGEAVAIGLALDSTYSHLMGYLTTEELNRILNLLQKLNLPIYHNKLNENNFQTLFEGLEEFREHLGGKLTVTILRSIGQGFEVNEIDRDTMKIAVKRLLHTTQIHEN